MFLHVDRPHVKVARWTIDRPERANGLGTSVARELRQALKAVQAEVAEQKTLALIITTRPRESERGATWIGGGDLRELKSLSASEAREYAVTMSEICAGLAALSAPVIAAVDGAAIGGGAELALFCDVRFATRRASLEFRQLRIGLSTGYGGARRLVRLVGLALAQELLFLGRPLAAEAAASHHLFHQLFDTPTALLQGALATGVELAHLEPKAVSLQKELLNRALTTEANEAEQAESRLFASLWRNPAHAAFLDNFSTKE